MASKYTYKEDIERQRYWVECKMKKELRLVADEDKSNAGRNFKL